MFDLDKIVRQNIRELKAYESARSLLNLKDYTLLDSNENPFGSYNRYPDNNYPRLKKYLSKFLDTSRKNIFIGNGSNELIDLMLKIFCNPQKDSIFCFDPTYGIYETYAKIADVNIISEKLDDNHTIKKDSLNKHYKNENLKIIFLCSPNNPTGNIIDKKIIESILSRFQGVVVVDEAYIDFCIEYSCIDLLEKYKNLIILRTMSKGLGLAGGRIGYAISSKNIINYFSKVCPPYNVSSLNEEAGIKCLKDPILIQKRIELIKNELAIMEIKLKKIKGIKKVYNSKANFILVKVQDPIGLFEFLVKNKILVRDRSNLVRDSLRLTVGTVSQNKLLLKTIEKYYE